MWGLLSAGLGAAQAYLGSSVQRATIGANNRVAAAQAEAANTVRDAANTLSSARGGLARYMQSLQNQQTLEAGGQMLEANLVNSLRAEDTLREASFEDQIRNAEALGSQAAAAAFSGVGGEVADTISVTTRLMQQRAGERALRNTRYRSFDTSRRAEAITEQTVRSLDSSLIFDQLDLSTDIARQQAMPGKYNAVTASLLDSTMKGNLNPVFKVGGQLLDKFLI